MKRRLFLSAVLVIILALQSVPIFAKSAESQGTAVLPDFPVYLNGIEVYQGGKYPVLVYKEITYFPMTWYQSRFMGLETEWSDTEGLKVTQNNVVTSSMGYYPKEDENPSQVTVLVPRFKIQVNGKRIDNSTEDYPLITFRDVTYFPLTWRFAYDEFGWSYEFSQTGGLKINSNNPQVKYYPALLNRDAYTSVRVLKDGYYYYMHKGDLFLTDAVEPENSLQIFRSPLDNSTREKQIYNFEEAPGSVDFTLLDGKPYMIVTQNAGSRSVAYGIDANGNCERTDVDVTKYINGLSDGNKDGQWTYSIQNNYLYRSKSDGVSEKCSDNTADWFGIIVGNIYYTHKTSQGYSYLYKVVENGTDQKVIKDKVRKVLIQDGNMIAVLGTNEDYGAKLFAADGTVRLALTDQINTVSYCDDTVLASSSNGEGADFIKVISVHKK